MPSGIKTPTNQVRLTNIAICKYSSHGKHFQIACYPSKCLNFREGVESDLGEVLQIEQVFSNVSRGIVSPSADLREAFGTTDIREICKIILHKGTLQQSNLERSHSSSRNLNAVIDLLCTKCVDPATNRPYPPETLRDAVKKLGYVMNSDKKPKVMFLDIVKLLQQRRVLQIERAKMLLKISHPVDPMPTPSPASSVSSIDPAVVITRKAEASLTFMIPPSFYRQVDDLCKASQGWTLTVEKLSVLEEGEVGWGDEKTGGNVTADSEQGSASLQHQQDAAPLPPSSVSTSTTRSESISDAVSGLNLAPPPAPSRREEGDDDNDDDEDGFYNMTRAATTREKKKQQRKSKKAARRAKEKEEELQQRIAKEKERQRLREEKLSKEEDGPLPSCVQVPSPQSVDVEANPTSFSCNTCGGCFKDRAVHRAHFKSDWHRYNLKLKAQGASVVGEEEFNSDIAMALFLS